MTDIEIPLGKRTKAYRFFEVLPGVLSYGSIIVLVALSLLNPLWASIYLLFFILTMFIKAIGIAFRTFQGRQVLEKAQKIDWQQRLEDLESPVKALRRYSKTQPTKTQKWGFVNHLKTLGIIEKSKEGEYPSPSKLYNAVIVATYNESLEVLRPTIQAVKDTSYPNSQIILVIAYEERGGKTTEQNVQKLEQEFGKDFFAFHTVRHPTDLPHEVIGKGGNITCAGRFLQKWLKKKKITADRVVVTTLDSDNQPHKSYLSYVTYAYTTHKDRLHLAFQPISLFMNNIWDAPAPMRVVATGNSFWNIISSMRPYSLRNFASHSQSMEALEKMDFWSVRTIVEDGHQYWRSYFYFDGNYSVVPIYIPIYQDAVLTEKYTKTLKAQFVQLRRWAYGASDIAYVATRVFSKKRSVPFWPATARLFRLIDGHVTLAALPVIVAFGAWVPLFLNNEAARSIVAHELPVIVSRIQQIALVGLLITVFLSFKMLPPRPERYKRHRTVFMLAQWVLMPVTAIVYTASSAFYSQTRLLIGKYLDKFDVTEKAVVASDKKKP